MAKCPGRRCPKYKVKCEIEERDQCSRHKQCPADQKCCLFACGKKCLDLSEGVHICSQSSVCKITIVSQDESVYHKMLKCLS
ncbi:WAP four-disulfide core domain protein 6B-like [Mastomys coucha]|uniref:WAP four-disulfide core domain protein 6B-like n=1 Tax=Mastomys coucha TaxID=35658 RepID=UPI0012625F59|nr:WAP four-disulfide core domain protein 6B-like [Mastomys coucha]